MPSKMNEVENRHSPTGKKERSSWPKQDEISSKTFPELDDADEGLTVSTAFQVHQRYIISQIRSGYIVIDQQAAHERILLSVI